ncbi:MAG: 50S ribosomal protein L25 [Candidatus Pacebacteria bacterium]|nr:50S ribosomal protein L25 [Candidatus Paceibacterota bacterium]
MLSFTAKVRDKSIKAKNLLKNGYLPAVVYGREVKNIPLILNYKEFENFFHKITESTIFNLKIEKDDKIEEYPVIIRDIQYNPVTDEFIHIDFFQLPMDREITINVPLVFIGQSPAEKNEGAVIVKNLHEIEIRTLPKYLIGELKVDLSSIKKIGDEIKIRDLNLPAEIKVENFDEIIAIAAEPEKEEIVEEVALEEEIEKVKVVKEKEEEEEMKETANKENK